MPHDAWKPITSKTDRPSITMREGTSADAPAIARVHIVARQAAYRAFFPLDYLDGLKLEDVTELWRERLQALRSTCLVAEMGGRIAGHVRFGPAEDGSQAGEVYQLHIDPDFWRRSIGSLLLANAEAGLHDAGFSQAVLYVYEANTDARAFYERQGWQFDGTAVEVDRGSTQVKQVRYSKGLS